MALQESLTIITLPAAGDLSSSQYLCVDVNSSGQAAVVGTAGAKGIGVLQNDPAAAGRDASVAIAGKTKVVAGAAVTAGAKVQADAAGKAITAASGDHVFGIAVTSAGAANELFEVVLISQHLLA